MRYGKHRQGEKADEDGYRSRLAAQPVSGQLRHDTGDTKAAEVVHCRE